MRLIQRIQEAVILDGEKIVADVVRRVAPDRHADRVEFAVDLVVVDRLPARDLVQPRQRAGEVGNAGERELIKGDGGHVVLTGPDRPYILCRQRAESL